MTTKEFKDKYPHYSHLEGDDLWNAMEFMLLQSSDSWTADYSEGSDEEFIHERADGIKLYWNQNKHWVNDHTGERITRQEFDRRQELKYPKQNLASQGTLESYRMDFLDFGTDDVYPKILFSE